MALALDPEVGVDVARDAVARALKAGADGARVHHTYREVFEVNFDTNDVTLVRSTVGDTLSLTVFSETRKGSTQLSGRAHDAVDRAAAQALEAAKAGQPDPANVLPEEAAEPATSSGDNEPDQEAMVDAVLRHISRVKEEFPSLRTDASNYRFVSEWSSYANSHDRVQHARRSRYGLSLLVTGKDDNSSTSFNYTSVYSRTPLSELGHSGAARALFEGTMASFNAKPVPATFVGDVIFTPEVLGTLVSTIAGSLGGIALFRRTTPFLDRLGDTVASPSFSLLHRPTQLATADPFDNEGFVNHDVDIISDGVLQNFIVDWYFAHKLDRPMTTGSADFVVLPGTTPLDEIIASTKRGIVLGRFSGGSPSQNLDFSGVAKNSFYVEDGKIQYPITETMIAGNFTSVLQSIRAISAETLEFGYATYPWLTAEGITISTK
jgi:PmbA protein